MAVTGSVACETCFHREFGVRFVPPDGTGTSGILIIGDSAWMDEVRMGKPFSGAAGYTLDRQLQLVNIQRALKFGRRCGSQSFPISNGASSRRLLQVQGKHQRALKFGRCCGSQSRAP